MVDPKHTIVTNVKATEIKFKITKYAGENVYALKKGRFVIETLGGSYIVEFADNTLTDGASVPDIFSCVREGWYDGTLRDVGAIVHDFLYTIKGECLGKKLSRRECDIILQNIDLFTGATTKKKSWLVRWAVGLFAGGKKHWGNDSFHQIDKIHVSFEPLVSSKTNG